MSNLRPLPPRGVVALTGVMSPLTGPAGAAHVYGPQKGASEAQVRILDDALGHLADVVGLERTIVGSGSAGGARYGLLSWGAKISPGADAIADVVGFRQKLVGASLLVTGEGQFDSQSSAGKVISHLLEAARDTGVPSALIAGRITASITRFALAESLVDMAGSGSEAMERPQHWAKAATASIARNFTNLICR